MATVVKQFANSWQQNTHLEGLHLVPGQVTPRLLQSVDGVALQPRDDRLQRRKVLEHPQFLKVTTRSGLIRPAAVDGGSEFWGNLDCLTTDIVLVLKRTQRLHWPLMASALASNGFGRSHIEKFQF